MNTIHIGLIGFGFMGKTHTCGYQTIPLFYEPDFNIQLSAVCANHYEKALAAKERYGFAHAAHNLEEILSLPNIDVIDICTPNALHTQAILKALDANKHIYCEKPVTCGPQETARILAHPNLSRVTTQTVFNNRFTPAAKLAKQFMQEERLGRILSFRTHMIMPSNVGAEKPIRWRNLRQAGGGVLYDLGSHIVDMLTWLAGPVASVYTKNQTAYTTRTGTDGKTASVDTEDASYSVITLANGAIGTAQASKLATGTNTNFFVEIHGEKGALKLDFMDPNWLYFYDAKDTNPGYKKIETVQNYPAGTHFPPARHPMGWLRAHVDCLYEFLCAVNQNRPAVPSLEDGLYVQKITDAMYLSAQENKEIYL